MQSYMKQIKWNCCDRSELGVLETRSFNILYIFSHLLRWLLKPLHGMQFETPVLGRALAKAWWCPLLSSAGCWRLAASAASKWGQEARELSITTVIWRFNDYLHDSLPYHVLWIAYNRDVGSGLGSRREGVTKGGPGGAVGKWDLWVEEMTDIFFLWQIQERSRLRGDGKELNQRAIQSEWNPHTWFYRRWSRTPSLNSDHKDSIYKGRGRADFGSFLFCVLFPRMGAQHCFYRWYIMLPRNYFMLPRNYFMPLFISHGEVRNI